MVSRSAFTAWRRRANMLLALLFTLMAGPMLCKCSPYDTDLQTVMTFTTATTVSAADTEASYVNTLKEWIGKAMDQSSPEFTRKLLKAEVSTDCSFGLLKLVRAIRNLDPWAIRLFDASGKYPTGALQATRADFGAFDECLETVLLDRDGDVEARGQYCSLLVYARNNSDAENYILPAIELAHPKVIKFKNYFYDTRFPTFRLAVCTMNFCNEQELQELAKAIIPPVMDFQVKYCSTNEYHRPTLTEQVILAFLAMIFFMVALGTGLDIYSETKARKYHKNALVRVALCFSLLSNTRSMLNINRDRNSDAYRFQFLHGLRFFSIVWIVIGHCYGTPSDVWSRLVNNISLTDRWDITIISAGFISVDTFFFLSAFLLTCVVSKHEHVGVVLFVVAVFRRLIRTLVPLFFMIMCMYLLPLMVSGPEAPEFFEKLNKEVYENWWMLLAQVRNYFYRDDDVPLLPHLWYLSLDFQFFLVALPILVICKKRPQLAITLFALLSLVGCLIATWQAASSNRTPFMVVIVESIQVFLETTYRYYFYPFYHAICYFMGCIAFLSLSWFKSKKMSQLFQAIGWCIAISSAVCCITMKLAWYKEPEPTTLFGKLSTAFFDRILWCIFLLWVTMACATGKGGFICKFLSWNAFVPLSRLAFGVYLIHVPFIQVFLHTSRERVPLEHYIVVSLVFTTLVWSYLLSFLLFIFCEAPTSKLDKLVFEGGRRSQPKPVACPSSAAEAPSGLSPDKNIIIIPSVDDAHSALEAQRINSTADHSGFFRRNGHSGSYQL
ncbi:nose resistant to fluoxetine protein 6 isoform X1 [Rhipicephalus microplus]|uniref:nose resistant to fluoxetine protein 6 isoform X1 n=2 Tax=Rhipicephalus microplus TaxID=6941 RepID=UPI003F6C7544